MAIDDVANLSDERTTQWLGSSRSDQLMVWSWVPFALAGLFVNDPRMVVVLLGAVLAFSFSHQVLTLPLVYGDRDTFNSRRLLFLLAPIVLVVGIYQVRLRAFVVLTVLAAAWNAFHTVQQRYGMVRLYGRKVHQDRPGVERILLFSGFFTAVVLAMCSSSLVAKFADGSLDLGQPGNNTQLVTMLGDLRPVALVLAGPLVLLTSLVAWKWWTQERQRPQNAAKHWYLASTFLMYSVAIVSPIAALMGFVGSHAAEYYLVVARSLKGRTVTKPQSNLARLTRTFHAWPLVVVFAAVITAAVFAGMLGSWVDAAAVAALTFGAMHFLFDGVIWRSGRPTYQATFRAEQE